MPPRGGFENCRGSCYYMLGPGRDSARSYTGAPRMAASTLLFRSSTHIEESRPHQIPDIPPAWPVSSVRARNYMGGPRVNKFQTASLAAANCSQIAEMKNERLQATASYGVPQSKVRFAGITGELLLISNCGAGLVLGEPCIATERNPLALPTLGCIFPLSNI